MLGTRSTQGDYRNLGTKAPGPGCVSSGYQQGRLPVRQWGLLVDSEAATACQLRTSTALQPLQVQVSQSPASQEVTLLQWGQGACNLTQLFHHHAGSLKCSGVGPVLIRVSKYAFLEEVVAVWGPYQTENFQLCFWNILTSQEPWGREGRMQRGQSIPGGTPHTVLFTCSPVC